MSSILALLAAHKLPILACSLCTAMVGGGAAAISVLYGNSTKQEQVPVLDLKEESKLELEVPALEPRVEPELEEEEEFSEVSSEELQAVKQRRIDLEGKVSNLVALSSSTLRKVDQYTPKRNDLEQCLKKNPTDISLELSQVNELFKAKEKAEADIKQGEEMLKNIKGSLRDKESKVDGNKNKNDFQELERELSTLEKNYEEITNRNSAGNFKTKWDDFSRTLKGDREKCGIKDMIRLNERPSEPRRN